MTRCICAKCKLLTTTSRFTSKKAETSRVESTSMELSLAHSTNGVLDSKALLEAKRDLLLKLLFRLELKDKKLNNPKM